MALKKQILFSFRARALLCAMSVCLFLAGCGVQPKPSASVPASTAAPAMTGHVHGGQQPIALSQIYLYAVSTQSGGAATSLLTAPGFVLSDLSGNFTITHDYTCPAGAYVYLLALGGNPGLSTGNNPEIALAAGLGPCSALSASTFITINEATTVAFAYSLAAYASSDTQIGFPYPEYQQQPFANIINLVDPTTGLAMASNDLLITQQQKLNSLANALAACVNSSGNGQPCSTLMTAANASPSNTFQAALKIAQNPTVNVASIYNIASPYATFAPALPSAPADWTISPLDLTHAIHRDANTILISSSEGDICVELRPDMAPKNVANFLSYVNSGAYNNSFIHRSVASFLIQGGGYTFANGEINAIPTTASVAAEVNLLNLRGTLAMAGTSGANSATDEFFFNTVDNFSLQTQNGGFTVIGQILSAVGGGTTSANDIPAGTTTCGGESGSQSLAVMDAINALPVYDFGSPFDSLPLIDYTSGNAVQSSNFVYTNTPASYPYPATYTPVPTALPDPGGVYSTPPTVTLQDAAPGAVISYYDFNNPNAGLVQYTAPFQLSAGGVLYVTATAPGYASPSEGSYIDYVVDTAATTAPPVITPKGGSFSGSQLVTISDATPGAAIYYTLDGTSPQGSSGILYTGSFTVSSSVRVIADAVLSGYTTGSQAQVVYSAQ